MSALDNLDPRIKEWATARQAGAIDALIALGSILEAAEQLGITPSRLRGLLSEARKRAAQKGYAPEADLNKPQPDPFSVKGVSHYYTRDDETGEMVLRAQWVKTDRDKDGRAAALLDALQNVAEPLQGKSTYVEPPEHADEDLMCVYPMGDPHIGMFASALETGEDFNLELGEQHLMAAVDHLVALALHLFCVQWVYALGRLFGLGGGGDQAG